MEQYLTAKEYADLTGRPKRTVRSWIDFARVKNDGALPRGVHVIAGAFVATRESWDAIAASKGTQGRRDHVPRTKKEDRKGGTPNGRP